MRLRRSQVNVKFGDHRVIRKFSFIPRTVVDYSKSTPLLFTIWLEHYDVVQKYYTSLGWDTEAYALDGTGHFKARSGAWTWGGAVIT